MQSGLKIPLIPIVGIVGITTVYATLVDGKTGMVGAKAIHGDQQHG